MSTNVGAAAVLHSLSMARPRCRAVRVAAFIVALHEGFAVVVAQHGPFAAHRLGDQERSLVVE
jgi:hypothetical protein